LSATTSESRNLAARPKLGLHWELGTETGWGLLGLNLALQYMRTGAVLPVLTAKVRRISVTALQEKLLQPALGLQKSFRDTLDQQGGGGGWQVPFPVIHPIGLDFQTQDDVTGTRRFGIAFIEDDHFSDAGRARAQAFEAVVAGSTWCGELVKSAGAGRVHVWQQGIDTAIFHPAPRAHLFPDRFVIFSGGKLEYRKAQDLVLSAFKRFHERHPEALLVCQWGTHFPQLAAGFAHSKAVSGPPPLAADGKALNIDAWLAAEGVPADAVVQIPFMPNTVMGQVYREADVALFPNRAEGGTNLVAMECAAAGVPVIAADNTGQRDLVEITGCYALTQQGDVPHNDSDGAWCRRWRESDVDEILERLEEVYTHRDAARRRGLAGAEKIADWSWDKQAPRLLELLDPFSE
jgi:glycosyltransferase involved in cell wall biosynthesis